MLTKNVPTGRNVTKTLWSQERYYCRERIKTGDFTKTSLQSEVSRPALSELRTSRWQTEINSNRLLPHIYEEGEMWGLMRSEYFHRLGALVKSFLYKVSTKKVPYEGCKEYDTSHCTCEIASLFRYGMAFEHSPSFKRVFYTGSKNISASYLSCPSNNETLKMKIRRVSLLGVESNALNRDSTELGRNRSVDWRLRKNSMTAFWQN